MPYGPCNLIIVCTDGLTDRYAKGEPRDRDGAVTAPVGNVPGSRAGTI